MGINDLLYNSIIPINFWLVFYGFLTAAGIFLMKFNYRTYEKLMTNKYFFLEFKKRYKSRLLLNQFYIIIYTITVGYITYKLSQF